MKKRILKVLAVILAVALAIPAYAIPVKATQTTSGNLTYANAYDWTNPNEFPKNNIWAFASTDSTVTPLSRMQQADNYFGWWNGVVFEYNNERDTWVVVKSDLLEDGTNDLGKEALGEGRLIIFFHGQAATGQADSYNFFKTNAVVGAEFVLTGDIATIQSTFGALSGVSLSLAPDITDAVRYQTRDDKDVRFIAYVDELEKYTSVAFVFTIDGQNSNPLVSTTAYEGLIADGEVCTTEDIYGKDGYFVTYAVNDYLSLYGGKEVTVTVTYTLTTGEAITAARTMTIGGTKEIESVNLTYANGYDWADSEFHLKNIIAFASANSTATVATILGGECFGYGYGMVLEYNSAKGTWVVTSVDLVAGDGNTTERVTLGDGKMVVIFYEGAVGSDFCKKYAVKGTELYLNGTFSEIQSTGGALSGVSLATGVAEN